jgi:hypothetical protein
MSLPNSALLGVGFSLLALACATADGVSETAAGSDTELDPTVMRRAVSSLRPTTCPARGAGLPHAASGSRSGGSSLRMNLARFTAIHQATTYLAHTGSCTGPIRSGAAHLSYRSTISNAGHTPESPTAPGVTDAIARDPLLACFEAGRRSLPRFSPCSEIPWRRPCVAWGSLPD